MLHLIFLNKYILALIVKEGNSAKSYKLLISLFIYLGLQSFGNANPRSLGKIIVPFIEKILLLADPGVNSSALISKFVERSIMGCFGSGSQSGSSSSLHSFSLRVLGWVWVS